MEQLQKMIPKPKGKSIQYVVLVVIAFISAAVIFEEWMLLVGLVAGVFVGMMLRSAKPKERSYHLEERLVKVKVYDDEKPEVLP